MGKRTAKGVRRTARRGHPAGGSAGWQRPSARLFHQGDLRLIVLRLVSESPRHGYDLIRAIEEASLGVYRPSAGAIYPVLAGLEADGFVEVRESENGRRTHRITPSGRAQLDARAAEMKSIDARLGRLRSYSDDDQVRQIRRSMDNLKAGLRLRLSRHPLGEAEIHRIVDAIDAAATAVERA